MKAIANTRVRMERTTVWKMQRTTLGVTLRRNFMFSHEMLESAHYGRKFIADRLRDVRQTLRVEAANVKA